MILTSNNDSTAILFPTKSLIIYNTREVYRVNLNVNDDIPTSDRVFDFPSGVTIFTENMNNIYKKKYIKI